MDDEWIKTSEELPISQDLEDECNDYYFIHIEGFGECTAMYCNNEWYFNYIAKIIRKVTHWKPVEPPKDKS